MNEYMNDCCLHDSMDEWEIKKTKCSNTALESKVTVLPLLVHPCGLEMSQGEKNIKLSSPKH